jgi:hypothetical protein
MTNQRIALLPWDKVDEPTDLMSADLMSRIIADTRAEPLNCAGLSEIIAAGQLIRFVKPSNRTATRVIIRWRLEEWFISLSAWRATEPIGRGPRCW